MSTKVPSQSRPGGRSARIQATVYQTVKDLLATLPREELNFPLIAAQAGVTPSTLYRRWGDMSQLLGDVALDVIRPTADPVDTGSLEGDLAAWVEQFQEESAAPLGRDMLRDMVAASRKEETACACLEVLRGQLEAIAERARSRGEFTLDADALLDMLAAPIVYRLLFGQELDAAYARALLQRLHALQRVATLSE